MLQSRLYVEVVVSFRTDRLILCDRPPAPTEMEAWWATKPFYTLWRRKTFLALTFSLQRPRQVVERRAEQGFENHLCSRYQRKRFSDGKERDGIEMLVYSPFNHLTRLLEREILLNSFSMEDLDQRFPTCAPRSPKGSACTSQGLRGRSRKIK